MGGRVVGKDRFERGYGPVAREAAAAGLGVPGFFVVFFYQLAVFLHAFARVVVEVVGNDVAVIGRAQFQEASGPRGLAADTDHLRLRVASLDGPVPGLEEFQVLLGFEGVVRFVPDLEVLDPAGLEEPGRLEQVFAVGLEKTFHGTIVTYLEGPVIAHGGQHPDRAFTGDLQPGPGFLPIRRRNAELEAVGGGEDQLAKMLVDHPVAIGRQQVLGQEGVGVGTQGAVFRVADVGGEGPGRQDRIDDFVQELTGGGAQFGPEEAGGGGRLRVIEAVGAGRHLPG
ncbi:MAG: hypothetical protein BWY73_00567 [candidate division TA06 bacterium ADurb.Bin417]|uniref:Uncharacterized protein n=1 Tax=candidate division TA06 bacterium ADurb.Bin417 TaxID=1852828 RepID=A0A1V5MJ29_UNCT6|nr:MAG: hypothetical protein BWY73_00567 [candidate division TA06 bacterium ADurb.Bin417]